VSFEGRSDLLHDAVVDERDARTAQTILDAWLGLPSVYSHWTGPNAAALLELRGILTVALADTRAAGVLEGYTAGRAEVLSRARVRVLEAVHEAMEDL
jgi:hypothetical protein